MFSSFFFFAYSAHDLALSGASAGQLAGWGFVGWSGFWKLAVHVSLLLLSATRIAWLIESTNHADWAYCDLQLPNSGSSNGHTACQAPHRYARWLGQSRC